MVPAVPRTIVLVVVASAAHLIAALETAEVMDKENVALLIAAQEVAVSAVPPMIVLVVNASKSCTSLKNLYQLPE